MRAVLDKVGRLVIPKTVRLAAGLEPGMEVEMRVVDGRIEIEPAPLELRLERRGALVVAVPEDAPRTLPAAEVEAVIDGLREQTTDD